MAAKNVDKYGVYPSQSTAIQARLCGLELLAFLKNKSEKVNIFAVVKLFLQENALTIQNHFNANVKLGVCHA